VSTVTRPVTQDALTAVKNAVRGDVKLPLADEKGSIRSTAPMAISIKNPSAMTAVMLLLDLLSFWRSSSRD
jgi:hypothetical protein